MLWIWLVADGVVWLKLTQREREREREREEKKKKRFVYPSLFMLG